MIPEIETILKDNCDIADGSTIVVACSGGPDSLALLDILVRLKTKHDFNLIIAHVNHHVRNDSSNDENIVKNYCKKNNIEFKKANFYRKNTKNLEDSARNFRNEFFIKLAKKQNAVVALAHNEDDQAESIMLHLIRGAGIKGLKGMSYSHFLKGIKFIRPLLDYKKQELLKYCKARQILYAIDSTNSDLKYKRNFVRHELIPLLKKHNPKIDDALIRLSRSIKIDDDFLEKTADKIKFKSSKNKIVWERNELKKLHSSVRRRAIALGFRELFGSQKDLSYDHIIHMEHVLIKAGEYCLPHGYKFKAFKNEAIIYKKLS